MSEGVRRLTIVNERGLHARASAKLVQTCETFEAEGEVRFDGARADMRSIMDLLSLAAARGSVLEARASGADAEAMLDAVEALVTSGFGEER